MAFAEWEERVLGLVEVLEEFGQLEAFFVLEMTENLKEVLAREMQCGLLQWDHHY